VYQGLVRESKLSVDDLSNPFSPSSISGDADVPSHSSPYGRGKNLSTQEWFMEEDGDWFGTSLASLDSSQQKQQNLQNLYGSEGSMGDALLEESMQSMREMQTSLGDDFVIPLEIDDLKPAYKKTITFADTIATPLDYHASECSLETLDIFLEEESAQKKDASSTSLGDYADDDESFVSAVDSVEEKEKKIRRQLLYAVGGVGFFALFGFAMKNILKVVGKAADSDDVDGGVDITNATDQLSNANDIASAVAGDGGSSYSTAASAAQGTGDIANASFNASASASHSQLGVGFSMGGQPGAALSGAQ
jgi:hypothetical protein